MKWHALGLLILLAPGAVQSADEWVERATPNYPMGNLTLESRWDPDDGIRIKVVERDSKRSVTFELDTRKARIRLDPETGFPPAVEASSQFQSDALPTRRMPRARITLKFRTESWALYVEDRPIAMLTAPFSPPVTVYQLKAEIPSGDTPVRYQKTQAAIYERDDFLKPEDESRELADWTPVSGQWKLHSAADNAIERENIKATAGAGARPIFEDSPNFYALRGAGTNASILRGYDFYDAYTLEAAVETRPGEMGILFHARSPGGFFGFTVVLPEASNRARLHLWKTASSNAQDRTVLAAVETTLTPRQWVKLRVVTFQNRIQCFMDRIQVIDIAAELPAGGRFGLFADCPGGTLFDDVTIRSNHDLDFLTMNDLRRYTLIEEGQFFPRRRFFKLFAPRDIGQALEIGALPAVQRLVVGSYDHEAHVFSATFQCDGAAPGTAGLVTGWKADGTHFEFVRQWNATGTLYRLSEVSGTATQALETRSFARVAAPREDFALLSDATTPGELRLYDNRRLVLIHHLARPFAGASGLYVGPGTTARVSEPAYRFHREDLYRNQFEKNRQFVEDPYMRHWSSPEGQWIQMTNGLTWYKGDLFGRFLVKLPFIPGTELHVGIPETGTNGAFCVRAGTNGLELRNPGVTAPLASVPTNRLLWEIPETVTNKTGVAPSPWFEICYEDYWLWATGGTNVLFKHPVAAPLEGRRMRVSGFTTDQLKHSLVEAYNVKDSLFSESLHEWTQNGGLWDVVNRFMCQPKWSHMNGESRAGLAALWNKFRYSGDFCVEMYVGTRHGWYQRCGDFNLTLFADRTSPGRGYTVTCGGWDPDHSQMYTRLYRNGALMTESDKYLVPRNREGGRRLYTDPLVPGGRDMHGAWYYVKFRRIGRRLEYYFDNEPVFSIEDSEPLNAGLLGVWTYMNSMMVARVKVAAQGIEPRPFPFTPVPPDRPLAGAPALPSDAAWQTILKDGVPLVRMLPSLWAVEDPVGQSELSWHDAPGFGPYFALQNTLGSGPMATRPLAAPVPYAALAGWRFEVKRTTGCQFNFSYSVGRIHPEKGYQVERSFFHRISGAGFPGKEFMETGATEVPGTAEPVPGWHRAGEWTPVTVWLPTTELKASISDTALLVRVEGFGNLHPSFIAQGLSGNGPGEAYAVRNFSEIRLTPPAITASTGAPAPMAIQVLDPDSSAIRGRARDAESLQGWVTATTNPGLIRAVVILAAAGATARQDLAWIRLPDRQDITCGWSPDMPDAIRIACPAPYPDRRLDIASCSVGSGATETFTWTGLVRRTLSVQRYDPPRRPGPLNTFTLPVPLAETLAKTNPEALPVTLKVGTNAYAFSLKWADRTAPDAPRLVTLKGPALFCEAFESQSFPVELMRSGSMEIRGPDPRQGYYLAVPNAGQQQRAQARFTLPVALDLARYPIVQFRYRASGMAYITLSFDQRFDARLTENFGGAVPVRASRPFSADGQWRTWQGLICDAFQNQPLDASAFGFRFLQLGSRSPADQTGLFTSWDLDDLAVGPAVSRADQLTFSPWYADVDGIQQVSMALLQDSTAYDDLSPEAVRALPWKAIPNQQDTTPDLAALKDGPCQILLKATDAGGRESPVTSLPFLLDRVPPDCSGTFQVKTGGVWNSSALQVVVRNGGGAPIDLARMRFLWNDQEVPLPPPVGSTFEHTAERNLMWLNWPHMFRDPLAAVEDGDTNTLVVTGLQDGAGNTAADLRLRWVTDFEADTVPPTVLEPILPSNILWCSGWEMGEGRAPQLVAAHGGKMEIVRKPGEEPYLSTEAIKNKASILLQLGNLKWLVGEYPLLAFRIRRPNLMPKDEARITLVLEFDKTNTFTVPLAERGKKRNRRHLYLAEPIQWRSNVWHTVMLDLNQFFRENLTEDKLTPILGPDGWRTDPEKRKQVLPLKQLSLQMDNAKDAGPLHLQSVFVFAPFGTQDEVRLNAFDVSGIAGLTWECEKLAASTAVSPAALSLQNQESGWMLLRARDKAGNLSPAFRFPLFHSLQGTTNAVSTNAVPSPAPAP